MFRAIPGAGYISEIFSKIYPAFRSGFLTACLLIFFVFASRWFLDNDQSSIQQAQMMISRIYGAWHPRTFCLFGCAETVYSRNEVVVVLIGDDFQNNVGSQLIPFESYAQLIRVLAEHGASVVFVDIVIADRPEGEGQGNIDLATKNIAPLVQSIRDAQHKGTKIVFAQLRRPQDKPSPCSAAQGKMPGALSRSLICVADAVAPIGWISDIPGVDYPIAVARPDDKGGPDLSPGVVVAIAKEGGQRSPLAGILQKADGDMYLSWGVGGYSTDGDCATFDPEIGRGWLEHFGNSLKALVFNFDGPSHRRRDQKHCTYLSQLPADLIVNHLAQPGSEDWEADDRLLRHRAVFVGLDMAGSRADRLTPPLGPETAGVFVHAVATENLLSHGVEGISYYRSTTESRWRMISLAALIVVAIEMSRSLADSLLGPKKLKMRKPIIWVLAAAAAAVLSLTLLRWALQLPSANVLIVLASVLIVDGIGDALTFAKDKILFKQPRGVGE